MTTAEFNKWAGTARRAVGVPFTKFKQHKVPPFMRRAIQRWAKSTHVECDDLRRAYNIETFLHQYLRVDHWGSAVSLGKPCFVSQPYNIDGRTLLRAEQWVEALGLDMTVLARSHHYPGRTFTILVEEPKDAAGERHINSRTSAIDARRA